MQKCHSQVQCQELFWPPNKNKVLWQVYNTGDPGAAEFTPIPHLGLPIITPYIRYPLVLQTVPSYAALYISSCS